MLTVGEKTIHELGGFEANTTNNRMELKGVIEALKYIKNSGLKDSEVIVHADSSYVLGGIESWVANWEKNGWKTANKKPVLNQELWQELIALVRSCPLPLSFKKVKGHSGHVHNERADEIATSCSSLQKNLE